MKCKNCGSKLIRKKDKYVCEHCGKMYAIQKNKSGQAKKHRKSTRSFPAWIILTIAFLLIVGVFAIIIIPGKNSNDEQQTAVPKNSPETISTATVIEAKNKVTPEPTNVPAASARFRAVGDIMSHKLQLQHAMQADGTFDYDPQFEMVKESLLDADYTIGNLELTIGEYGKYSSYPKFRTPVEILDSLKDCGVDFLTIANNHILDGFQAGLNRTLDALDERGFTHVGAGRTEEERKAPVIVEVNGIRFGMLAYTFDTNDNEDHEGEKTKELISYIDGADYDGDVRTLRELGAEIIIALPHWGEEDRRKVTPFMEKEARKMVAAGVDIILGSHPHMVFPIDVFDFELNGKTKKIMIAWSLGNFISYMANQYVDSGIILDFTVVRNENGEYDYKDIGYVPVYVWGNKNVFHLVCSGEFYDEKPRGMSESDYSRMRESVREIVNMCGKDFNLLSK